MMRILIVDDDQWLSERFAQTLRRAKYLVTAVHNGIEAMATIDSCVPDVIVLDLFMPGPNGLVLLHELQSHADLSEIPVVLCSNSAGEVSHSALEPYGVRAILDKMTMEPADLVSAVRKVLS